MPLVGFFALPALRRSERRWLEGGPVSDFVEGRIEKVLAKPLVARTLGRFYAAHVLILPAIL